MRPMCQISDNSRTKYKLQEKSYHIIVKTIKHIIIIFLSLNYYLLKNFIKTSNISQRERKEKPINKPNEPPISEMNDIGG